MSQFLDHYIRLGFQAFFQPSTIPLPAGVVLNEYGWIPIGNAEIVLPMVAIRPEESRTLYWYSEKIVTNSTSPIRMSLEGNFQFDTTLDDWPADTWRTIAGYTISSEKNHEWQGLAPVKTVPGEAIRLRLHPGTGNNNDMYFKFLALDLPFIDDPHFRT